MARAFNTYVSCLVHTFGPVSSGAAVDRGAVRVQDPSSISKDNSAPENENFEKVVIKDYDSPNFKIENK